MTTREVQLEGAPPWGFRMNGGADSGHPLRISRVNPGSKAESKGVREGDLITSINGHSTKCLGNSDSHALLRTVKENLRLGLNEDQNGSPRRRSREMKSSPAASEKDVLSTLVTKENAKPSRSKLRRKRKQRLKALLKEKLLGYRETPGHVITDHPVADGYEPSSSMGGSLGHEEGDDDTSSRKLYDNVVDSEVPGPSSERVAENNMPGSSEQCLGTVAFIRKEISTVSPPEVDPNKHHISANTLSRDQVADGNQEQVSKSPKTVTFFRSAVQHAEVHVWEKRPKSTIDDGYEDDGRRHPSSILLDNVMDSNPGASLDSVAGKNISGGSRENLKTGEAIREEMSTVGPSVVNTCPLDPNNHHIAFTAVEIADPNQEQVSKYSKIVTFVPQQVQHAQVHVSEKRPESTSFDNGYDDDSPSLVGENIAPISKLQNKTHNNIPKAVEVITYSAEDGLPSEDYVVQDEDGVKEESKQFFPSNDLVEVLSSTTDDENVYELVVSDIHDPLIVPEEEAQLRTYLGTLSLHEPACVSTEEVRVGPPTEIPAYFLPPKRYLDVISEENSDLSDGDRPWENSEKIKLANAIDTIPEDWFGSQDGIDTSWRDGKSLEDMSDILVVTDSHSDSELTIENSIQNSKQPAVIVLDDTIPRNSKQGLIRLGIETNSENKYRNSGGGNQVTSRGDIVKNVVSSFYTPKKTLQPLQIETIKNSGTVEGPNSEVVEIVYLDSSDSEAISSSRSETNLATTPVPQELLSTSPVHQFSVTSSVSKSAVLPTVNTDVVEIVCINSGDDEAVSAKIGNDVEINSPPGGTLVSNNSSPSADQPSSSQSSSSSHVTQIAADVTHIAADRNRNEPTVQKDMVKISEMISDITHSANEIISTSTEHLARLTCTSPPTYKSKNTNVTARMILRERCSSLPLLDEDSKSGIKSTRSVCSDTGNESDYPHFICNDDSDVSSQTTRLVDPMVATLKELSMGAVLRLPFGISFLKQLGFDQSEYDSYSGYMPEGSEYSFSSKHQFSEREYILADDTENEDESISGGLPQTTSPSRSSQSEKWIGVQIPKDTKLLLAVSPNASKTIKCSHPNIVDLLDLHQKFIERRGYHESEDKFPATMYDQHVNVRHDEDTGEDFSEFRALQEYHALRQKKMREAAQEKMKTPFSEEIIDNVKKNSNFNDSSSRAATRLDDGNSVRTDKNTLHNVSPITVVEEGAVSKIKKDRSSEHAEVSAGEGSEGSEVGNSRLLELIQREEFKGSCDELNMTTATFPCWILLDKQSVSQCESVGKGVDNGSEDGEKAASSVGEGKSEENDFRSRFAVNKLHVSSVDAKGLQRERPKSVPPSGERFRQLMYEEYMNKLAELSQRRRLKAIKLSEPSKSASTPSVSVVEDHLKGEFMDRVRERMTKLGLTDDFVLVDSSILPKPSIDAKTADDQKKLPKHVQELMDIADELGVWSPAQTPETEKKVPDFPAAEKRERLEDKSEEPAPPVWTPRSAGPSPTLGRKFRPVNFQSPPPQRKEYTSSSDKKPELPKDLPPETSTSVSSNSSSRLISSTSENSTLTHQSTQLRLPSSQNPTITLLQKAREGQIPKGAQYLEDTAPDRPSGITPDEIIYSVKKEYSTADDEGVHKVVELSPKKFSGIGPTTRDGIPVGLRSEVNETNQQRWYKRMYDSLHKTTDRDKDFVTVRYKTRRKGQYPYTSYVGGYASEPERLAGYDSDASISKYATLDRRKIRNKENDFTTSTLPRNRYAPSIKHAVNVYKNQPGRIEDYEPGNSSIAEIEKKQWWDEVLDIFDGELNNSSKDVYATPSRQSFTTYALKDTGYDSDSTLVFKRRENMSENLSPAEQRMAYKVVQSGGEVPLHGLRKSIPDRPKESPHRYVESEVNIHYKTPVRSEAKVAWPEDELAEKQAEIMRRIYQEQRRTKYLNELHDMYSRRHTDNLLPSQKSPIPLNRYDDFPLEPQPPRPRDRTPEPKLVARALYNFIGQTSRELSFRRGDIIYVRRQIDKNWYEGEHNAMIGLFPFNYVEIIPYDGIRTLPRKASEGQARAKFNFQAQTHLELSLVKGELVLLTRRVDENWFEGRIGNRKGIFPVSYVEVLVEPGERTLSPSGPVSTKPVVAPASHSVMLNGAKDIGQQHYQPPRPALYSSSSLPHQSKMSDISMVSQSLHIDTQSDPVPYRVLYNYKPQNDDELELKEGDVVYVMEKCDDGWYVGSLHRNGQFGTFPGNYVERILH